MSWIAEDLRWMLIGLQVWLIMLAVWTGTWRRLPVWTAWLTMEAISRMPFDPGGNYWHLVWKQLQPGLLLLLIGVVLETKYQAMHKMSNSWVLVIAPVGLVLSLPELIWFRVFVYASAALTLAWTRGSPMAVRHARIMAWLTGAGAATGWPPAGAGLWWAMRVSYLVVYIASCLAWIVWLSLPGDGLSSTAPGKSPGPPHVRAGT